MNEEQTNSEAIDWPFLVPILTLAALGVVGMVVGEARRERMAREQIARQEALQAELEKKERRKPVYEIPYDLNRPDWLQVLPVELNEVSGFAVGEDGEVGWAVNDEVGKLYPIALVEGLLGQPSDFAGPGDYEGLERVGDELVVARSDGTLYRVSEGQVNEVPSLLDYDYNVEGLALDGARSRLLVACKGKAGPGKQFKRMRAVYSLSLPEYTWNEVPAFTIAFKDLKKFIKETDVEGLDGGDARHFSPSAIAVTPDDQHIYVLSTTGRMLVVLDVRGTIVAAQLLPRQRHRQPEGLTFDSQGSLYIANEGRDRSATLYRFDPKEPDDDEDEEPESAPSEASDSEGATG